MRKTLWLALGVFLLRAVPALAYPSSIVFAPTGDVKKLGEFGAFVYTSMDYDPAIGPGPSWLGVNAGVAPAFSYGDTGTGFGGVEIGIDAADPTIYAGDPPAVKPMLNVKAQVLTETTYLPHFSVGTMDLDPFKPSRSANIIYFSATKTAGPYGRLTFGMGDALTADRNLFSGTAPFWDGSAFLLGGYESPQFGPLSFGIDYFGGSSDLSSTNVAIDYAPLPGVTTAFGGFFANDRRNPATTTDGLFVFIAVNWEPLKSGGSGS